MNYNSCSDQNVSTLKVTDNQSLNVGTILYVTPSGASISLTYFIICIVTLTLAIWIIILNMITIFTLLSSRTHYTNVSHIFIASLSIADLVTGIMLVYITAYSLLQFQNFIECLIRFGLTYTVAQSSYIHVLAITIDRYIKIIFPLHYRKIITKGRVVKLSGLIWFVSLIIGLLPLFGWHRKLQVTGLKSETVCRFFGVLTDGYFLMNLLISLFFIIVTVILYTQIAYVARDQYKKIQNLTKRGKAGTTLVFDEHAWRLAKTIAIVVVVSNLCWLPGVFIIVLHMTGMLDHLSLEVRGDLITYCSLLVFLNSLINPVIYASKIQVVRERFRKIFCSTNMVTRNQILIERDSSKVTSIPLNNFDHEIAQDV